MTLESWQPYLIATVVGLLVGIEREKAQSGSPAIGVRTFLLLSLLGAVAGDMKNPWISGLIAAFALVMIALSYFNSSRGPAADRGLTTEFAAGVVFSLAFVSHSNPVLSSLLGPLTALILYSKESLHRFTRKIDPSELETALLLLLLGLVVVNVIEDKVVDPWGIFNPRKFGLIILILATLEFGSYLLTKVLSEKNSALFWGLLGGLVSSTAVLLASVRQSKEAGRPTVPHYIAIIASQCTSLTELLFIVGIVSPSLLLAVVPPVAAVLFVCSTFLLWSLTTRFEPTENSPFKSPLDWLGVIRLAVVFAIMLGAVAIAQKFLGQGAVMTVSILGGSFELHGITLANATMLSREQLSIDAAQLNILAAITASFTMKSVLGLMIARNRFAILLAAVFAALAAVLWFIALAF